MSTGRAGLREHSVGTRRKVELRKNVIMKVGSVKWSEMAAPVPLNQKREKVIDKMNGNRTYILG